MSLYQTITETVEMFLGAYWNIKEKSHIKFFSDIIYDYCEKERIIDSSDVNYDLEFGKIFGKSITKISDKDIDNYIRKKKLEKLLK